MSQSNEEAARTIATLWTALVDEGVPPEHATKIVVGMIQNAKSTPKPMDMAALFASMEET